MGLEITEISAVQREVEQNAYEREKQSLALIEQLRFFPLVVSSGHGTRLVTPSGRELIDFSASWSASGFGHGNPRISEAVSRAITNGAGSSALSSAVTETTRLAERLIEFTPVKLAERVYLGLGGTDANSAAIAAVRKATGRKGIVTFSGSYHGGHGLSQDASGMALEDVSNDLVRVVKYPVTSGDLLDVEKELGSALRSEDVACVIVEAVQCDGGVNVPPVDFLKVLRRLCDETQTMLIVDEVKAGLGRTGYRHAFEASGIFPDIVTFGKALGGGVPCAAAIGPAAVMDIEKASALLTLSGNPVSSAAANAVLDLIEDSDVVSEVKNSGQIMSTLIDSYRASDRPGARRISDHRGRGLLHGIELGDSAEGTRQYNVPSDGASLAALTSYRAWELGCVLYVVRDNVLELTPPLLIAPSELRAGLEIVFQAIDDAATGRVSLNILEEFGGW